MRRSSFLRGLLALSVLALSLCVVAGFFGAEARPFDSVGHFRYQLALVLLAFALVALLARAWTTLAVSIGSAALGLAFSLPWLLPQEARQAPAGQPSYTLLQMNLLYDAPDKAEALRRIGETRPDIVTLQEVTFSWQGLFQTLAETYPFQTYCGLENERDGVAILSRRPFLGEALCQGRNGRVTQWVDLNGRALAVTALHLDWPWPKHHWEQIEAMGESLKRDGGPSLLGGDFNAAPWSAAVREVADLGGWRIVRGIGPTWLTLRFSAIWPRWLGLPIDQLLVSPEILVDRVETLARTSSDHLPVLLRFSLLPSPPVPTRSVAEPATAQSESEDAVRSRDDA
jgi:endonuclease/exonuclease/phosphatase (EEP) superfamily protein YafD